jgi:hypothetical protein
MPVSPVDPPAVGLSASRNRDVHGKRRPAEMEGQGSRSFCPGPVAPPLRDSSSDGQRAIVIVHEPLGLWKVATPVMIHAPVLDREAVAVRGPLTGSACSGTP